MSLQGPISRGMVHGALAGAVAGAAWWALYLPASWSLWLLVLIHAAGGLVLAGILARLGLTAPLVLWCAVVLSALGLPAAYGLQYHHPWSPPLPDAAEPVESRPVAVIGIDGGDWRLLQPMLDAGEMPNLADLVARGQHGVLRSIEPSASPVLWMSIFTGRSPSNHGVANWELADARNLKEPTLWEILGARGWRSLVVNVPGTWPAFGGPNTRLVSGFPLPLLRRDREVQAIGTQVSTPLPGSFVHVIAHREAQPRISNVRHGPLERFERAGILNVGKDTVTVSLESEGSGIAAQVGAHKFSLQQGERSKWLSVETHRGTAWLQMELLGLEKDSADLYVSPAFLDVHVPNQEVLAGIDTLPGVDGPYIVEGVGWMEHRNPDFAHHVADHNLDVARIQLDTTLALLAKEQPDFLTAIITVTDRMQHSFLGRHEGGAQPGDPDWLRERDAVADSYRSADAALGRILDALPEQTQVWVVSDHGAVILEDSQLGEGGHRHEGIWVASGPGVSQKDTPLEMNILDVLPSLLRCNNIPVAPSLDGRARESLCTQAISATVDSYGGSRTDAESRELDAVRLEQIKSLGYTE